MKILLNPIEPDGAPIKNVYYKDELFFNEKENDVFFPGTVREFENEELSSFFKNLYDFLTEVDTATAKKYLEKSKEVLRCDNKDCDFKTSVPVALAGHKRKHEKEQELSELGLPVVKSMKSSGAVGSSKSEQDKIDEQTAADGLTGEGLRVESFGAGTIMS